MLAQKQMQKRERMQRGMRRVGETENVARACRQQRAGRQDGLTARVRASSCGDDRVRSCVCVCVCVRVRSYLRDRERCTRVSSAASRKAGWIVSSCSVDGCCCGVTAKPTERRKSRKSEILRRQAERSKSKGTRSLRGEPKGHGSMLRPLSIWLLPLHLRSLSGEGR